MFEGNSLSSQFDQVYELLEKFNFNLSVHRNVICVLCHTIIIDAYRNICGCRYCNKCIFQFTEFDDKCCPGYSDLCKLVINKKNIIADQATNRVISLLDVKCPVEYCDKKSPLKYIYYHIQSHKECPFVKIGCQSLDDSVSTVNDHMSSDKENHMILLVDKIEELQNQIDDMEENSIKANNLMDMYTIQNSELTSLKSEIVELKTTVLALGESLANQKVPENVSEEVKKLRCEIDKQKIINEILKDEIKALKIELKKQNDNSLLWKKVKRVSRLINSFKLEINRIDKNYLEKLAADILALKKDTARLLFKNSVCRRDYKSLDQHFKTTNTWMESRYSDQKSSMENFDMQLRALHKEMIIVGENFKEEKELRNNLEETLNRARLDIQGCDVEQKQLASNVERVVSQTESGKTDLVRSTFNLDAQVKELYRYSDLLMTGKVHRALEKPIEWLIEEFPYKLQRAIDGRDPYIMSQWFNYIDYRVGFKMYPFCSDAFAGTHMSLFMFIIKKTARVMDPASRWITISVVDQVDGSTSVSKRFSYSSLVKEEPNTGEQDPHRPLGAADFFTLNTFQASERFIKEKCLLIRATAEPWEFDNDGM